MSSDNGGIIGVVNDPTSTVASGVWQQEEQYEAKVNDTWPQRALFTTKSLRFDDGSSDYLTKSVSSTSNRRTFTYSTWVKRSNLSGSNYPRLFNPFVDSNNFFDVYFRNTDALNIYSYSGGSNNIDLVTTQLFRDVSAWYHIVLAVDTTQGTEANRVKLYVNGSQVTSFSTSTYPSQNADLQINVSGVTNVIGRNQSGTNNYFDGYMAEIILVDGSQLAPTSFGVTNSDGVWTPIIYSGTYGTNGFNLQFENASALGTDSSSNGNNFTVNNLTSIDQSTDYPEVNFATLNPLIPSNGSTSNGNLDYATSNSSNNFGYRVSTIGVSSGKFYAECKYISGAWGYIGIRSFFTSTVSHQLGYYSDDYAILRDNGKIYNNNSGSTYATSWSTGDIIGVALDCDNNKLYFSKNGQWSNGSGAWDSTTFNSSVGDITIGSASSSTNGAYFFACNNWDSSTNSSFSWNYGSPSYAISSGNVDSSGMGNFEYAVPSGYYSLCTRNLNLIG
tara:strand:- start:34 stop:1539 length:1506 start_codon:yes stop_codon:yes gene_type:complete